LSKDTDRYQVSRTALHSVNVAPAADPNRLGARALDLAGDSRKGLRAISSEFQNAT